MIIIILTIDRYRCICQPTLPRYKQPGLYCGHAFLVSFLWQVPRLFINTAPTSCLPISTNDRSALSSSRLGRFPYIFIQLSSYGSFNPGECEEGLLVPVINISHLTSDFPWVLYVVLAELFMR